MITSELIKKYTVLTALYIINTEGKCPPAIMDDAGVSCEFCFIGPYYCDTKYNLVKAQDFINSLTPEEIIEAAL